MQLIFFVSLLDYQQPGTTKISESSDAKPEIRDFFNFLQNQNQIRSSLSESVYSKYFDSHDWPSWKFVLETWQLAGNLESETNQRNDKSCKVIAKINILHVSIVKKDLGLVKLIMKLAEQKGQQVFEALLYEEVNPFLAEGWQLSTQSKWILNASAIHFATYWHPESLVHLLKIKPELINRPTSSIKTSNEPNHFTPLHVASTLKSKAIPTSILINIGANVEAKDFENKTPLHIAAKNGCFQQVMALLYDGNANIIPQDIRGETPLHQAKNSKIVDLLLSTKQVLDMEEYTGKPLFDKILQTHPSSLNKYLNKMVTSSNKTETDVSKIDQHLIFNLSMFNSINSDNQLDKHLALMKMKHTELLTHPLMKLFFTIKRYSVNLRYKVNLFLFLVFLLVFTAHALIHISYTQCVRKCVGKANCTEENDQCEDLLPGKNATNYLTISLYIVLIVAEILQFTSYVLTRETRSYFGRQNITEFFMFVTIFIYFVVEWNQPDSYDAQAHLLGWALFLAWTNLTNYLTMFDFFGERIYWSWAVAKNVTTSIIAFIPTVIAFSAAFHCFLSQNDIFQGSVSSGLKTLTMMLGEFEFKDNFMYDEVKKVNGSNISVQVYYQDLYKI